MRCDYCHGVNTVEEGLVRFCLEDAPEPYFVENIPAKHCDLCGDKTFSGEVVSVLEKIGEIEFQPVRMQQVKVYDYALLKEQLAARALHP